LKQWLTGVITKDEGIPTPITVTTSALLTCLAEDPMGQQIRQLIGLLLKATTIQVESTRVGRAGEAMAMEGVAEEDIAAEMVMEVEVEAGEDSNGAGIPLNSMRAMPLAGSTSAGKSIMDECQSRYGNFTTNSTLAISPSRTLTNNSEFGWRSFSKIVLKTMPSRSKCVFSTSVLRALM